MNNIFEVEALVRHEQVTFRVVDDDLILAHLNVTVSVLGIVVWSDKEIHQDSLTFRWIFFLAEAIELANVSPVFDDKDSANIFLILSALLEDWQKLCRSFVVRQGKEANPLLVLRDLAVGRGRLTLLSLLF